MAKQLAKRVTILTNGNTGLADELDAVVREKGFEVESKAIVGLKRHSTPAGHDEVEVTFEDGSTRMLGFISHRPKSQLRGPLADQLELALTPSGDIATSPPFLETSVKGVFAVGDCSTMLKVVSGALSSGSFAGGGAAVQIQQGQ
jgi:gliotoxin/aspirochlorine biosynthesis thioredoxin reductase